MVVANKVRVEQEHLQSEERLAEVTRRIYTLRVEEAELKDALGRSQAEETRLYFEASDFRNKLMAADVLGDLTEVCRLRTKNEPEAVTSALAMERLANKNNTDRLQKELAKARTTNDELRRMLQRSVAEKNKACDEAGARLPMVWLSK